MRAYQVFSRMLRQDAERIFAELSKAAPGTYAQTIALTSTAINARPAFVLKQKLTQRAETMRRVLSRVRSNEVAEEVLAAYFVETQRAMLIIWLDAIGLDHEDGILVSDNPEEPDKQKLSEAIRLFRDSDQGLSQDRELLMLAFSAQTIVEWPGLDEILGSA